MLYEDYKLYGPYQAKDGRLRVVLVHNTLKTKRTVSYPKYLMEQHLERYLKESETVDHIDGNFLNNEIHNLQVLDRSIHIKLDSVRNRDIIVNCTQCGDSFTINGSKIHERNRSKRGYSGYFCSKQCSGLYGANIQNEYQERNKVEIVKAEKFKVKNLSALDENLGVEYRKFRELLTGNADDNPEPSRKEGAET